MTNKLVRLKDVQYALESMKLVSVSGLKFTLTEQHNQTIRDAQGLMDTIKEAETLEGVLERLPKEIGGAVLQYGTNRNTESPFFYCGYTSPEGDFDTFTTRDCAWGDTLIECALKLEVLLNSK